MELDLKTVKLGLDTLAIVITWVITIGVVLYRGGKKAEADKNSINASISKGLKELEEGLSDTIKDVRSELRDDMEKRLERHELEIEKLKHRANNFDQNFKSVEGLLKGFPTQGDIKDLMMKVSTTNESVAAVTAKIEGLENTVGLIRESLIRDRESQGRFIQEICAGSTKGN